MKWLALDIGGANIKAADGGRFACSQPFQLWRHPAQLTEALRAVIATAAGADHLAVTMTGELADCYRTRAEGVQHILTSVQAAADGRHTRVYLTDGRLVSPAIAAREPLLAAAANWHVLARFAGRHAPRGPALLMDVGSTTTDIIPLVDGRPAAAASTDPGRLCSGELVYTGVERSPVCAVLPSFHWHGAKCPIAHEVFATTWDAYLTLGHLPEEPSRSNTANGRPATRAAALDRLARCVCADRDSFTDNDAQQLAEAVSQAQQQLVKQALAKVLNRMGAPPAVIITSGQGEFLARAVLDSLNSTGTKISLGAFLGPEISRCATAHALAVIAHEASSSC